MTDASKLTRLGSGENLNSCLRSVAKRIREMGVPGKPAVAP